MILYRVKQCLPYLRLFRLLNLLLLGSTQIVIFYFLLDQELTELNLWYFLIGNILITGRGYALNDWFDRVADRLNRPDRPLVNGAITVSQFWWVIAVSGLFSFFLCLTQSPVIWQTWLIAEILLVVYARWNKKLLGISNLMVAGLSAWSVLLTGVFINSYPEVLWLFVGFSFWLTLIREIIKDLQDQEGDRLMRARTLPITFGEPLIRNLVRILLSFFVVSIFIFCFWQNTVSSWGVGSLLVGQSAFILFEIQNYARASLILKLMMFQGLLFLLFIV